jgi:hypothetical protein
MFSGFAFQKVFGKYIVIGLGHELLLYPVQIIILLSELFKINLSYASIYEIKPHMVILIYHNKNQNL